MMRRVVLLAGCLLCLAVPASASAAITRTDDANAIATAINDTGVAGSVGNASFFERPPIANGSPFATADVDSQLGGFPHAGGSYAILTTGDPTQADQAQDIESSADLGGPAGHGFGGGDGNAFDPSVLQIPLNVP